MVPIFQLRELRHRGASKWPGLEACRWQTWANLLGGPDHVPCSVLPPKHGGGERMHT